MGGGGRSVVLLKAEAEGGCGYTHQLEEAGYAVSTVPVLGFQYVSVWM